MNFKATVAVHAPTFNCPNCNHEIKLTESLAAPLFLEPQAGSPSVLTIYVLLKMKASVTGTGPAYQAPQNPEDKRGPGYKNNTTG